jgi:hypothetical protein
MDSYSCNVNWTSVLGGDDWKSMSSSLDDIQYTELSFQFRMQMGMNQVMFRLKRFEYEDEGDLDQGETERLNESRVDEDALQQQAEIECVLTKLKKGP